jgi:hypothetical protein
MKDGTLKYKDKPTDEEYIIYEKWEGYKIKCPEKVKKEKEWNEEETTINYQEQRKVRKPMKTLKKILEEVSMSKKESNYDEIHKKSGTMKVNKKKRTAIEVRRNEQNKPYLIEEEEYYYHNKYPKYDRMIDNILENTAISKLRNGKSQMSKMIRKVILTIRSKKSRSSVELNMKKIGKQQNKSRISKTLAANFARGFFIKSFLLSRNSRCIGN